VAIYNQAFLVINGALIQENVTVETSLSRADSDFFDMREGWIGIDASPAFRTISVRNMIPRTGAEFNFEKACLDKVRATLSIIEAAGGKGTTSQGYFTSVSRSIAVGQNYSVTFEFRGTAQDFS